MFELIDKDHPRRSVAERVIRTAYAREYGATLEALPSRLVGKLDGGRVECAASLRFAADGFFSETYLDCPIERAIGGLVGVTPARSSLVEVGSLAASRPGYLMGFIHEIIGFSRRQGARWAFFTATARLRAYLRREGLGLIELAVADPARIDHVEAWGSYYQHDPRVMLVGEHMARFPGLASDPPVIPPRLEARHA
jgi:hypothetical protein